ncbi:hypothetical protein D3C85_1880040 [compost metagenome]
MPPPPVDAGSRNSLIACACCLDKAAFAISSLIFENSMIDAMQALAQGGSG